MTASKEKESRDTSDISPTLLIKQHLTMASSSLLHARLPVSVVGTVATFLLWQVCCWAVVFVQVVSPTPLGLL